MNQSVRELKLHTSVLDYVPELLEILHLPNLQKIKFEKYSYLYVHHFFVLIKLGVKNYEIGDLPEEYNISNFQLTFEPHTVYVYESADKILHSLKSKRIIVNLSIVAKEDFNITKHYLQIFKFRVSKLSGVKYRYAEEELVQHSILSDSSVNTTQTSLLIPFSAFTSIQNFYCDNRIVTR